jgi:hypothetical protein
MADLGNEMTEGSKVIAGAYVVPPGEGRCRKFWQFSRMLAEAFSDQEIIARAIWRIRAFSGVIPDSVLAEVGEHPAETIGNDQWLQEHDVKSLELNNRIARQLRGKGIREDVAKLLAWECRSPHGHWSESEWRQHGSPLVFDELVQLFQAAGFNQAVLLIAIGP